MERRAGGGGGGLGLRHDPVLDFVREGGAWSPAFPTLEIDPCATEASDSCANDCLGTRRPADRWTLTRDTPVRLQSLPIQSHTLHFSYFLPRLVIEKPAASTQGLCFPIRPVVRCPSSHPSHEIDDAKPSFRFRPKREALLCATRTDHTWHCHLSHRRRTLNFRPSHPPPPPLPTPPASRPQPHPLVIDASDVTPIKSGYLWRECALKGRKACSTTDW